MGQLPKYKIQEAKKAKREEKINKKRKVDTKPQNKLFLIVCEGEKTEPNYFEAIKNRYSDVKTIDIKGTGYNTLSLLKEAQRLRDASEKDYDRVWIVFDKDDFNDNDFNKTIISAKKENIECAWSNEAFELWYVLHFCFLASAIGRKDYIEVLEREIKKKKKEKLFKYKKNSKEMYSTLNKYGDEETAIKNAIKLEKKYTGKEYAKHKPCTMVHKLVQQLK